ncbi:unnamed protein product [Mycena citricolor]|uniref:C2H2-type domain-containing protein n=1 Tax=Mycena citricolor TaxID=2018698 RepID=A0AAD2H2Z3_9AGAR|nr:unnamed protein product [Mycena citricolor]
MLISTAQLTQPVVTLHPMALPLPRSECIEITEDDPLESNLWFPAQDDPQPFELSSEQSFAHAENSSCDKHLSINMEDAWRTAPTLSITNAEPDYSNFNKYCFRNPSSGASSPISPMSPASTYSSVFPEDFPSDNESRYKQGFSSYPPSPVTPSLLLSGFRDLELNQSYAGDQVIIQDDLADHGRARSYSSSGNAVAPGETWGADNGLVRGRAASFSGPFVSAGTSSESYPVHVEQFPPSLSIEISSMDPAQELGTSVAWGSPSFSPSESSDGGFSPGSSSPLSEWMFPAGERSMQTQFLAVPGMHRRSSTRHNRRHSDTTSLGVPEVDAGFGRGRGIHRVTQSVSGPHRSASSASSVSSYASSRDPSPVSFDYPSPSEALVPGLSFDFSDPHTDNECETVGNVSSLARRKTFTTIRNSSEVLSVDPHLVQHGTTRSRNRDSSLGVFRAASSSTASESIDGQTVGGSQSEFQVVTAPPSPGRKFKKEVASTKIRSASAARRMNKAVFNCTVPGCPSTFTARHNLKNHMNSHQNNRPFVCPGCSFSFTTQGVMNRHVKKCRH